MYSTRELPLHKVHSGRSVYSSKKRLSRKQIKALQHWCRIGIAIVLILSALFIISRVRVAFKSVVCIALTPLSFVFAVVGISFHHHAHPPCKQAGVRNTGAGQHCGGKGSHPVIRRAALSSLNNLVLVACHAVSSVLSSPNIYLQFHPNPFPHFLLLKCYVWSASSLIQAL